MPEIGIFKGIYFNPEKVNLESTVLRLENLVSLLESKKEEKQDDRPIVRLTREFIEKTGKARDIIERWREKGILIKDSTPTIYIYHQIFELKGIKFKRKGWIAPCLIEPLAKGKILPHESTFSWGTKRHLDFLKAVRMNFAPVLVLYSDPKKNVDSLLDPETQKEPLLRVRDEMGSEHMIWPVKSRKVLKLLFETILDRPLVIADGHHRYEASLKYRNEITKKLAGGNKRNAYMYRLMAFSNVFDDGIVILPTHRHVMPQKKPDWTTFFRRVSRGFRIRKVPIEEGIEILHIFGEHSFGLYRGGKFIEILTLRKENYLNEIGEEIPREIRFLDVVILHSLFLEKFLNLSPDDTIQYIRNAEEVIREVKSEKGGFLFLLNAPSPIQVFEIAKAGRRMPPKSTDFYPKLVTGLLMMDIEEGSEVYLP